MARELPIHNGRMTTDLDANGFKIKNLPPGSGFTQAQADNELVPIGLETGGHNTIVEEMLDG